MRLLLINSNTNTDVTAKISAEACQWAGEGTDVVGVNARFGAEIVSTRTEAAISQHALLDACAVHAKGCDAVIVGMSLDSGVWAAREFLNIPVIGMTEAALHMASLHGNRIGLLVFGSVTQPYREMVEAYGYACKLGAIEALGITPKQHLQDPGAVEARIIERTNALANQGLIDAVILVGAVAAGLPSKLQNQLRIPAFEGISCAVLLAESLVRMRSANARAGSFAAPQGRVSLGLGPELTTGLGQSF